MACGILARGFAAVHGGGRTLPANGREDQTFWRQAPPDLACLLTLADILLFFRA